MPRKKSGINHWPLCEECSKMAYIMISVMPKKFPCGHTTTPPHAFSWKMCGECAEKNGVCAGCGKKLP